MTRLNPITTPRHQLRAEKAARKREAAINAFIVRISRKLGSDFARSRARVSRHRGQPFHDCGQAGRQGS